MTASEISFAVIECGVIPLLSPLCESVRLVDRNIPEY